MRAIALGGGGADDVDGYGGDFLADAVAGNDGDARVGTAVAEGDVGHESVSDGVEMSTGYVASKLCGDAEGRSSAVRKLHDRGHREHREEEYGIGIIEGAEWESAASSSLVIISANREIVLRGK